MNWHWKELLPVDRYTVRAKDVLHDWDRKILTLLYQPLIGAFAYSLYLTLWSELEKDVYWSDENTHRYLMTLMDSPLNIIYQERKKLEAIGLLKTYKKKEEDGTVYLYELQPPMSPHAFFNNDVLSVYLYNRLGKSKYRQIRERFMLDNLDKNEYQEMTHAFDEVFSSLHHSEIVANFQSEISNVLELEKEKEIINRQNEVDLVLTKEHFDFDLLMTDLSAFIAPKELLTKEIKDTIVRLSFVYRIEPLQMSRILQQSIIHDDQINLDLFRKKVQEWYKIEHGSDPPSLGLRSQPLDLQTIKDKEPISEEEKVIKLFETKSPIELLESRSDGSKVPPADVKIIEGLLLDYQLQPGVVNVLIDFILTVNDMKLSKPLIDKIAGHWKRKNVKTVNEAMELARQEYKAKRTNFNENDKKQAKPKKSVQQRKDKLPKWLLEEKERDSSTNKKTEQKSEQDFEVKKQLFEQMLKQRLAEKNKEE